MKTMTDIIYKQFTSGSTRITIMLDECAPHPWLWQDMVSSLACWSDWNGSFLPHFHLCDEEKVKKLSERYPPIEDVDDMKKWVTNAKQSDKPYLIYGITYFDKYGGLVLHKDIDIDHYNLDGAIFIGYDEFCGQVDGVVGLPDEKVRIRMDEILQSEFDALNAYFSNSIYGWVLEKQCDKCNSWVPADNETNSIRGYYSTSSDDTEMLRLMATDWEQTEDIKKIILQMGI